MRVNFLGIGAACAAVGVALGAFGAHTLRARLGASSLVLWETATRYWFVGTFGAIAFGLFQRTLAGEARAHSLPGVLLVLGSVLFSASLYALALGAPRAVGAVTPFGGLCLIAGFSYFAWVSFASH